ncbi:MAG: D-alanyl-D-alanine carboxypeptidase [Clostridiales bacterium]|nr:D-alanyl-D-alanine carboxypeptidase [Clostridiales bacterium]
MKKLIILIILFVLSAILSLYSAFLKKEQNKDQPLSVFAPVYYGNTFDEITALAPSVSARSAILTELQSGAVLYEKNADERLPMASTTKIMTSKIILSRMSLSDVVSVPKEAALIEGSSIYLKEGEKISVKDLLYGLLLESGNDAAYTLAHACAGSEGEFVKLMNEEAEKLKLYNTHFANPHGLSAENHYTTARDLASLTKAAMENGIFREIVSTKTYVSTSSDGVKRYFSNHNKLLKSESDIIGVKTGYTKAAGRCLVTAMSRSGSEYAAVTLDDRDDWRDHKNLFSYAFENFRSICVSKENVFAIYLQNRKFTCKESVYFACSSQSVPTLSYTFTFDGVSAVFTEFYADGAEMGKFCLSEVY